LNQDIFSPEIQKFIKDHEHHDPFALLLKYKQISGVPVKDIALQIQSRQKAKKKLPEWHETDGIFFPPPISLEQCSSQDAAIYKASHFSGPRMIDLTGGMGIDTYYFSKKYDEAVYLEKEQSLSDIARHNFNVLNAANIQVVTGEAQKFIESVSPVDLIYIDPSRRAQKKIFLMKDSEPDVQLLLPDMFKKSKDILIKLSPLMDISSALDELQNVFQVHVVAIGNEVKEILYHLKKGFEGEPRRRAVNIRHIEQVMFAFYKSQELAAEVAYSKPQKYLYEPNAAVLKSGAFKILSRKYKVAKLHRNSHLYTSQELVLGFPGKAFLINDLLKYDPRLIFKSTPQGKANLVVRNFPISVEKIRAQTRVKEGGEDFLFFTTDLEDKKIVIKAVRVGRME
jgi:hypothetical protein